MARHNDDNLLKKPPCGNLPENAWGEGGDPEAQEVWTPGEIAYVEIVETSTHRGAPMRIAMSFGSDDRYDDFVLLDHVPHRDEMRSGGRYRVPVRVPDIACTAATCSIQVLQVMTDKFSTPCANPGGIAESCGSPSYAYFSCAPVVIAGSTAPEDVEPFYFSWLNDSTADDRVPYQSLSSLDWVSVEGRDGVWTLDEDAVPPAPGSAAARIDNPAASTGCLGLLLLSLLAIR